MDSGGDETTFFKASVIMCDSEEPGVENRGKREKDGDAKKKKRNS